jgi:hypothetical protein
LRSHWVNWKQEELAGFDGRRQPSLGGTSRISREPYVRFCERLRVKFPGPTRRRQTGRLPCRFRSLALPRLYAPRSAGESVYLSAGDHPSWNRVLRRNWLSSDGKTWNSWMNERRTSGERQVEAVQTSGARARRSFAPFRQGPGESQPSFFASLFLGVPSP